VLEKVDQHQRKIKQIEDDTAQTAADVRRVAQEVEATAPKLRGQATELQAALSEAEKILPANAMTTYRRLVQAHGAGALATVENSACTACFEILTANYLVELNTGKFLFCRSCGRLLYRPESD
jgi:uncharacterized protein